MLRGRMMAVKVQSSKKEDRRTRKTKAQIKVALIELMAQKDITKISVKEIAERADINRGTFYLHYYDIYDVLEQIQNEFIETINQILDECSPHAILNTPLILFEKITTALEHANGFKRCFLLQPPRLNERLVLPASLLRSPGNRLTLFSPQAIMPPSISVSTLTVPPDKLQDSVLYVGSDSFRIVGKFIV